MEIQSKDIKSVTIDSILFGIDDVYKGSQYDDTCISEIQLVNKGEIIQIKNRDNMQQQYITHLQSKLKKLFQDMKYEFNLCNDGSVFFSSDATIKHKLYGPCDKALPERWKVKGARLFFYYKGKWQLVKYYTDISFESFFIDKIGNTNFNYSVEYSPVQ